ncbi:MAG TPA: cupin [Cyanobacteria bacterium UBA8156]|jgi:uncharacterized cupin superfamily protein|nr:cupin [Cyanobacteria bacterium UBA8156]
MLEGLAQGSAAITVVRQLQPAKLQELGICDWPIWSKEVSAFDWHYDDTETCYLLAGDVAVTTAQGETVRFGAGDLVTFPAGLSCRWQIHATVRKHYRFGS